MSESPIDATAERDRTGRAVVDDAAVHERETILLPVGVDDGDRVDALAETAAEVAGMMETTVHVVHVFTDERFENARTRLNYDDDAPVDEAAKRVTPVRETVDALEAPLRMWGTTMSIGGRVGDDVGGEIVAAAEAVDAKRVLVGGRRRTPTGKVVFGSTAQRVLLDAPCPVTFVRDASHG